MIHVVNLLTHGKGESYSDYIEDIATNYDAIRVKRKDLKHNSTITRLKGITLKDQDRILKYHSAYLRLGNARNNFKEYTDGR